MEIRSFYAFAALQIIVICGLSWMLFTMAGPWDLERISGSVLGFVGIAGIVIARYQLGRSFAIRAEAHRLVTHGVYSKIRNPIYVFGTFVVAGFVLIVHGFIPSLLGWFFVLVVVVVQAIRAHREARVLEAAFGDAYRDYRRQTWF
jgi:protein-S-isoprenylcysteine O-methyltransferase Ste14